jgi:hypothetical protein
MKFLTKANHDERRKQIPSVVSWKIDRRPILFEPDQVGLAVYRFGLYVKMSASKLYEVR